MTKQSPDAKFKRKECCIDNCTRPIWSNCLCKVHYNMYYRGEKETSFKNRSVLKRMKNEISRIRKSSMNTSFGYKSQVEMFEAIWKDRIFNNGIVKSELSGRDITDFRGTDKWYSCFAHILPKQSYPKFILNPDNICLCHPDEHHLIDQGTTRQREIYSQYYACDFEIFFEKRRQLSKEYVKYMEENID